MNPTLLAVWISGLLLVAWASGCGMGFVYASKKKGTRHAHARKR